MKRKILSIMMVLAMCLSMYPAWTSWADTGAEVQPLANFGDGSSTAENPYEIPDLETFEAFCDYINGTGAYNGEAHTGEGEFFKLTADIDLGGEANGSWTPIGTDSQFKGTFDGDGHMITGLYINDSSGSNQGLFGSVGSDGTVKNLGVDGEVTGGSNVGGIVGRNFGTIENCYYTGAVSGSGTVGGIAGENNGSTSTVEKCYNTGTVTGSGSAVGGLVGGNDGKVQNSYNIGTVTGSNDNIGGIVGRNGSSSSLVENCYNTGAVSGNNNIGGIVGDNYSSTIQYVYNTGAVSGNSYVAGIIGYSTDGTLSNGYDAGTVSGRNNLASIAGYFLNGSISNFQYNRNYSNYNGVGSTSTSGVSAPQLANFKTESTAMNDLKNGSWTFNPILLRPILIDNPEIPGDGSQETPYKLSTADHLKALAEVVNAGTDFSGTYFELTRDIDLSSVCGEGIGSWTPIGNRVSFGGIFDGKEFEISNLYINEKLETSGTIYEGLFGRISGKDSKITNLTVSGTVTADFPAGGDYSVAGIVGYNNLGLVDNCVNKCDVTYNGAGRSDVGGIAGYSCGTITNSCNGGSIEGSNKNAGGIVGKSVTSISTATVENCFNIGKVSSKKTDSIGGIVGVAGNSPSDDPSCIKNCYNIAQVSGPTGSTDSSSDVGGIVGRVNSESVEIGHCYNIGEVITGSNVGEVITGSNVGGIVGYVNSESVEIGHCYYLDSKATTGIGNETDPETVVSKTEADFNSGEVAYLLQEGQTPDEETEVKPQIWYQQLTAAPKDKYPVLTGDENTVVLQITYILNGSETEAYLNPVGTIHVDEGDRVKLNDVEVTLPNGGEIDKDGDLVFAEDGTAKIGDTAITLPEEGKIEPAEGDKHVTVPEDTKVEFKNGPEVNLPEGGVIDKDGNIVGGTIEVGGTTVTAPDDDSIFVPDGKGNVYVPDGSIVKTPGAPDITVGDNDDKTIVDEDGNVTVPENGSVQVGGTTATIPEGGTIEPNEDDTVTVPAGTTAKLADGTEIDLPEGGTIDSEGNVTKNGETPTPPGGDYKIGNTTIVVPGDRTIDEIKDNGDGTVTVPDGSIVKTPGAPDITVGENDDKTIVDEEGNVTVPENGSVEIGSTTATIPGGGTIEPNEDDTVTVPAGTTAKLADGTEIDLPDGGTIDSEGHVKKNGDITPTPPDDDDNGDDDGDDNVFKIGNTTIVVPEDRTIDEIKDNGDGTVTVPDGSIVKTPGAPDITVGENDDKAIVDEDGNVTVPENGSIQIGDIIVTVPKGGVIMPNENGTVTVPKGSVVKTSDGEEVELQDGGVIDSEGNVKDDDDVTPPDNDDDFKIGDTTIIVPAGGTVQDNGDGTVTTPKDSTVIPPKGPEMTLPDGGIVDENGNVTLPDGGDVQIGKATIIVPAGGTIKPNGDGTVTIPEGSIVKRAGQEDVTVSEGGAVYDPSTNTLKMLGEDKKNPDDDTSKDEDDGKNPGDPSNKDDKKNPDDTSGNTDAPTQSPDSAAKTGDENSLALWITLLGLSGLVLCWNLVIRRKRKNV